MASGRAAFIGRGRFATALALAVAGAFVDFGVLIGAYVFVCDGTEALRFLHQVGFGLGVLEVKQRVVFVGVVSRSRLGIALGHGRGAGRNVGSRNKWYGMMSIRVKSSSVRGHKLRAAILRRTLTAPAEHKKRSLPEGSDLKVAGLA